MLIGLSEGSTGSQVVSENQSVPQMYCYEFGKFMIAVSVVDLAVSRFKRLVK